MVKEQLVYNCLLQVARQGKTISYTSIGARLGLDLARPHDLWELLQILNNISIIENLQGRPLLPAVAVIPETGYPERGFFILARELCVDACIDERCFYSHELKLVHDYWQARIRGAYPRLKPPAVAPQNPRELGSRS